MARTSGNNGRHRGSASASQRCRRWAWAVLLAVAFPFPQSPLSAMVVRERDFSDLVARAEQIVVGTVREVHASRDASGAPLTMVELVDLDVFKGDVREPFTLELYGGTAGDTNVRVSGTPRFSLGDRAVLFIAGNGESLFPVVGVWQGLFRVSFDAERGTEIVANHARVPVVGLRGRRLRLDGRSPAEGPPPLTVDEFEDLIERELRRQQRAGDFEELPE